MPGKVTVLIVDDSAYMRVVLKDILESDGGIRIVGTSRDGTEAIDMVKSLSPDVVLLDIQMPKMDGVATLRRIMREAPSRVVMLSAMDKVDDQLPLRALELGAVDFISKPSGPVSVEIVNFKDGIIDIVKKAALAKLEVLEQARAPLPHKLNPVEKRLSAGHKIVVLGASMGGPRALETVFAELPKDLPASILIVQHISYEFSLTFAKRLDAVQGPPVTVAVDGQKIEKGCAYLAPGGRHLTIAREGASALIAKLDDGEPVNHVKPSADVLFKSAARAGREKVLAVVLTGMGADGAEGAVAVKAAGGMVIVQNEETSAAASMPMSTVRSGAADMILPLEEIPKEIVKFAMG